jgi:hypothetical protein
MTMLIYKNSLELKVATSTNQDLLFITTYIQEFMSMSSSVRIENNETTSKLLITLQNTEIDIYEKDGFLTASRAEKEWKILPNTSIEKAVFSVKSYDTFDLQLKLNSQNFTITVRTI